jgi:hypothetical protein
LQYKANIGEVLSFWASTRRNHSRYLLIIPFSSTLGQQGTLTPWGHSGR